MNERLDYLKYLFAILWKYREYFAMNLLKRSLSKTFGPNRMIFFQMYRVKAIVLSIFPKALLLLNLEWKLALGLLGKIFLLLNLEPDCAVFLVSEMGSHWRPRRVDRDPSAIDPLGEPRATMQLQVIFA